MRKRVFSLLLLLFLGFAACATLPREPSPPPAAEELLERLRFRSQALQGLKGLAYVRVSAPGKNFIGQEVIFARRPGLLRLETLSPLGNPLLYFVAAGQELFLYHPGENRYYQGAALPRHFSALLPAGLEPEEAVLILLGDFPLLASEEASVRYEPREGLWLLDVQSPARGSRQVIGIDPQSREVLFAEYSREGLTRRLSFSDFKAVSPFSFPHKIHFVSPAARTELTVEYQEVTLNPEWEAHDFRLPVPKGAQVVPLE